MKWGLVKTYRLIVVGICIYLEYEHFFHNFNTIKLLNDLNSSSFAIIHNNSLSFCNWANWTNLERSSAITNDLIQLMKPNQTFRIKKFKSILMFPTWKLILNSKREVRSFAHPRRFINFPRRFKNKLNQWDNNSRKLTIIS